MQILLLCQEIENDFIFCFLSDIKLKNSYSLFLLSLMLSV